MKTLCAWCGSTIAVNCDHCGAPLVATTVLGASLPFAERDAMTCVNGMTPVLYTSDAIRRMPASHGICPSCLALPTIEREARLARRRTFDHALPSAADLDAICAERELAEKHEQETRRADRAKPTDIPEKRTINIPIEKRGPTGVPAAPTSTPARPRRDTGKRGKP